MFKHKWIFPIGMFTILIIIFIASSQTYEQQDMRPFLGGILNTPYMAEKLSNIEFVYAGSLISVEQVGVAGLVEFFIRKAAHFTIFGLLGFFTCGVVHTVFKKRKIWSAFVSLLFVMVYACLDELHQKMTGGRTPLLQDVVIDTVGGLFGIAILMIIIGISFRKRKAS